MKDNNSQSNIAYNIKHADFVSQIQLKEFLRTQKDVTHLRDMTSRLEAIFGDDEKEFPTVEK